MMVSLVTELSLADLFRIYNLFYELHFSKEFMKKHLKLEFLDDVLIVFEKNESSPYYDTLDNSP